MKDYEIRDVKTNDVLVYDLSLEEAKETLKLYQEFFGERAVYMHKAEPQPKTLSVTEYKEEYISYFGVLQRMGNLI